MALVHIGLGANLGARRATLRAAVAALGGLGAVRACSSLWETAAVGAVGGPDYLNAAAALETSLAPEALLDELLAIERRLGRVRTVRDAPRTIDLDILLWEQRILDGERLAVPHPRLHQRAFALLPLSEIAPDALHPVLHMTVRELSERLPPDQRAVRLDEPAWWKAS